MKLKLLLLGCLICQLGFAQKNHVVTLNPDVMSLENREFNIIKVIDNRTQKENLGIAQKGMSNKKYEAVFPEEFVAYLEKTLNEVLPTIESKRPIIVKVDKMYISEKSLATKEIGICEISLEFLEEIDGQLYSLGKFSNIVEESALDVTNKHGNRILSALQTCLYEFNESDWQTAERKIILDDIQPRLVFDFNSPPTKGLYLHFDSWVNQSPHETEGFIIRPINESSKIQRFQVTDQKKKKIKNLYAFSDGASLYLHAGNYAIANYFVKSDMIGPYVLFTDQVSDPTMAVAFGAVGALASTKSVNIVLNTETGFVTILNKSSLADILSNHPELLELHQNSKKSIEQEKEIIRLLNDKLLSQPNPKTATQNTL